jgi:uncharacterized delta-60 repeat protein
MPENDVVLYARWVEPASWSLDPSYGSDGVGLFHSPIGNTYRINSIALDSAGRTVATGESWNGSTMHVGVWRFTTSGVLDSEFASGGHFETSIPASSGYHARGEDIAIDSLGRIVVSGISLNATDWDMAVLRLTPDGTLDTTFGSEGFFVHDAATGASGDEHGLGVAIDGSDRIVVAGDSRVGDHDNYKVLWRLTSAGDLDSQFGGDGLVTDNEAPGEDYRGTLSDVAIDSEGRIVAAGFGKGPGSYELAAWRVLENGSFDTTFHGDGVAYYYAGGDDFGRGLTIDPTAGALVAGDTADGMAVWRLLADGQLDSGFGVGGVAQRVGGYGYGVAVDGEGMIVCAGGVSGSGIFDALVWRLTANGEPDLTFASDGTMILHDLAGGDGYDIASAAVIDSEGRILAAGYSEPAGDGYDAALWRITRIVAE